MDEGLLLRDIKEGERMEHQIRALRDLVSEWCRFDTPAGKGKANRGSLASRLRGLVTRR